jgi:hypothetical protein
MLESCGSFRQPCWPWAYLGDIWAYHQDLVLNIGCCCSQINLWLDIVNSTDSFLEKRGTCHADLLCSLERRCSERALSTTLDQRPHICCDQCLKHQFSGFEITSTHAPHRPLSRRLNDGEHIPLDKASRRPSFPRPGSSWMTARSSAVVIKAVILAVDRKKPLPAKYDSYQLILCK